MRVLGPPTSNGKGWSEQTTRPATQQPQEDNSNGDPARTRKSGKEHLLTQYKVVGLLFLQACRTLP